MKEFGEKHLNIRTGAGYDGESDSLMALMCERWEELSQAFGSEFPSRFGDFGADAGHVWDCLAPYINASMAARRDFLEFCETTDSIVGVRTIIALARERPSSDLLLAHCWRVFEREVSGTSGRHSNWAVERTRLEIAYIFREHFKNRIDVRDRLREGLKRERAADFIALTLTDPDNELFGHLRYQLLEIGRDFSKWVAAIHIASIRSAPATFVEVLCAMVNRKSHNIWDFQEISNRAVIDRLQRDGEVVNYLKDKLAIDGTGNERASLPRYLASAGQVDDELYERCRLLLQDERKSYVLPRAGYDSIDDSIRTVSRSLLDVLSPSFVI